MQVHHIGYLVKKIEKAKDEFLRLGYEIESDTVFDPIRSIDICFLKMGGERVELVSAHGIDTAVGALHKKIGNTPYHICYTSNDFYSDIARLDEAGYNVIQEPEIALALGNKKVAFLYNKYIGMLELLEW